jgi:hypothetical protein
MFVRPPGPCDADHGYIQMTTSNHVIKSGKDFFVSLSLPWLRIRASAGAVSSAGLPVVQPCLRSGMNFS